MKSVANQKMIIEQLQQQILSIQSDHSGNDEQSKLGLGQIESAFPGNVFPRAAVHELVSFTQNDASCTNAFIAVLLSKLMQESGYCIWINPRRKIYPPALKNFGVDPEKILFVDASKTKDALWSIEEALKCNALSAVVGEISELGFNESRRLQLAVEKSKVTGFIHRHQPKSLNAVACVSRWKISPVASSMLDEMPGVGFPKWEVELVKVRNGKPDKWIVQYSPKGLEYISESDITHKIYERNIA
jgi:protein ImuA